ncbi:hypothetical protein BKI49_20585 [Streptomyces sp. Tue6028]|uniref:hypothetical protein n=1 Tax=Streptomyces sp. Tue6028 TaxID=2036037 RepID=UPI000BB38BC6|nr:hypothetical protein [Streptomyces sp. Tue6028]PBC61991.1 hypothetical protein BKI49_20585 [Streptomyces sp. Tue6028]
MTDPAAEPPTAEPTAEEPTTEEPRTAEPATEEPPTPPTLEQRRLAEEKKNERMVWYYLAYFLFGIHIVAFVMIYAVRHAK